jgi:hypothetical protein
VRGNALESKVGMSFHDCERRKRSVTDQAGFYSALTS